MKPLIGIPGNVMTPFDNKELQFNITYTPGGFVDGLQAADAAPVVFPIAAAEYAEQYVQSVDAVVLAGGQDVSPFSFGEEPSLKLNKTNPQRDEFEIAIIKEAIHHKKPILAVCRGMQIYNITMGGTLYQDLSFYEDLSVQHIQMSTPKSAVHSVDIDKDAWIAEVYGRHARVNSFHHQAIHKLGDNMKAVAWAKDGIIEGFESNVDGIIHTGIQWHPEWMLEESKYSQKLFSNFVNYVSEVSGK